VPDPLELAVIGECRLDVDGLTRQRARYRALGRHVTRAIRGPGWLAVRFDATTDLELLRRVVEVERGCCPFFEMRLDVARRELVISVSEPQQDPALDAIADSLGEVRILRSMKSGFANAIA
jgi:hypothetical protein